MRMEEKMKEYNYDNTARVYCQYFYCHFDNIFLWGKRTENGSSVLPYIAVKTELPCKGSLCMMPYAGPVRGTCLRLSLL